MLLVNIVRRFLSADVVVSESPLKEGHRTGNDRPPTGSLQIRVGEEGIDDPAAILRVQQHRSRVIEDQLGAEPDIHQLLPHEPAPQDDALTGVVGEHPVENEISQATSYEAPPYHSRD